MPSPNELKRKYRIPQRTFGLETAVTLVALVAAIVLVWNVATGEVNVPLMLVSGVLFTFCVAVIISMLMDPDSVRARQTDSMLQLSSEMVDLMQEGLNGSAAQSVCELLLPNTAAISVAITDREFILGYSGYMAADNPIGSPIRTSATHDTIVDGCTRIIYTPEEIGLPAGNSAIKAAIIVPLIVGREIYGTLKFYFKTPRKITETQKSIAQGFGRLLSTQIAASEMETQRELATSMELKMLQSQINPHFLFNTINTIASLIRTDPARARVLLRDFAAFYRSTLEDSQERIPLSREIEQTRRYFTLETARFGDDRLEMIVDLSYKSSLVDDANVAAQNAEGVTNEAAAGESPVTPSELSELSANAEAADADAAPDAARVNVDELMVPPFLLQPLVENAVKHAMPAEGKLTVVIGVQVDGSDLVLVVADDGVGMSQETCEGMMSPEQTEGLGIAVKNVHDRLKGFFGQQAEMVVQSEIGTGTAVTLRIPDVI
jgi:two-component system sensor histidine kinase LytS